MVDVEDCKFKQRCAFCYSGNDDTVNIVSNGCVNRLPICKDCLKELVEKSKKIFKKN